MINNAQIFCTRETYSNVDGRDCSLEGDGFEGYDFFQICYTMAPNTQVCLKMFNKEGVIQRP